MKTIFKNAAAVNYGPVPKLPANPYTPANNTSVNGPYPYDPSAAAALLKAHGWKVVRRRPDDLPEGRQRRRRVRRRDPGGDAAEVQLGRSAAIAVAVERARRSGVRVRGEDRARRHRRAARRGAFDYQLANFDDADPSALGNRDDWAIANDGAFFYNYYPASAGTFNTGGVFNAGGFSDARADTLMTRLGVRSGPERGHARGPVPDRGRSRCCSSPGPPSCTRSRSKVGGDPLGFGALTQQSLLPQYWYVNG